MGRKKKLTKKVVQKSDVSSHEVQQESTDNAPGAYTAGVSSMTGVYGRHSPVASLDLTVTYDYSCEESSTDPVKSMEELSGLFYFKDTRHTFSSVASSSALWADVYSQPPMPKRAKNTSPCAPEGRQSLQHLVSTMDELKQAAAQVLSDCAVHDQRWEKEKVDHDQRQEGPTEGDEQGAEVSDKGQESDQRQPRVEKNLQKEPTAGDGNTQRLQWAGKADDTAHHLVGVEVGSCDSDSSEDGEFWKGAALLLSQQTEDALDQESFNKCDTNLYYDSISPKADLTPPATQARHYNSHQVELKRLKAIQLLSERKQSRK